MENWDRAKVGRMGEDIVCEYLTGLGHTILERNWRTGHLEVDIISLAPDGMHFVEVKTRVAPSMVPPEENVRSAKRHRMAKAAGLYLAQKEENLPGSVEAFLDVATVVLGEGQALVEYFPGAYVPIYFV